jgi:hypothetical protein
MTEPDTTARGDPLGADRSWASILIDRRRQWLEALGKGVVVRDRFHLRDKTAIVRLRPSDAISEHALEQEMDRFVRSVDEMSYQILGISLPGPLEVEPWPTCNRRAFYGGAYLLSPEVPDPPEDDTWGLGSGNLRELARGLDHDSNRPGQS